MANAIQNPADIVNLALGRIGYRLRVADLYDGSDAATAALDIYSQTLDTLLRDGEWGFAQRMVNGTVLKQAPTNYFDRAWDPTLDPPMPWQFSYAIPTGYLKVRSIRPPPGFLLDMDPTPLLFNVVNDNGYTPPRRVIVCNQASAVIVFAAQVTDPTQWPVDFIEALAAALARRLAAKLTDLNVEKMEAQDEAMSAGQAAVVQG